MKLSLDHDSLSAHRIVESYKPAFHHILLMFDFFLFFSCLDTRSPFFAFWLFIFFLEILFCSDHFCIFPFFFSFDCVLFEIYGSWYVSMASFMEARESCDLKISWFEENYNKFDEKSWYWDFMNFILLYIPPFRKHLATVFLPSQANRKITSLVRVMRECV